MKKMTSSGMSLVEILIVTVVSGTVLLFIGSALRSAIKGKESFLAKSNVKSTMVSLMESVVQAGRLAESCTWTSGTSSLQCIVDTNNPPTPASAADDTTFTFRYHKDDAATCQGNAGDSCVVLVRTHASVPARTIIYNLGPLLDPSTASHFIVCSDAEITGGTCPLGPTTGTNNIPARHAANLAPEPVGSTWRNRFFRVGISALDPDYSKDVQKGRPFTLQTAFFRRNPIPGFGDLRYQWGSKE